LKSCQEIFASPGRDSFRCPHRKIIHQSYIQWRRRSCNRPSTSVHLPGCVVMNHCQTFSPQFSGALWCWNHKLCLTARGASLSSPGRTVSSKSLYPWGISLPGSRPMAVSPLIAAQTLMLKWTWYTCSWIALGVFHVQRWPLWTFNTPSRITCFISPQNVMWKEHICSVLM
jgi:hypothetical protein